MENSNNDSGDNPSEKHRPIRQIRLKPLSVGIPKLLQEQKNLADMLGPSPLIKEMLKMNQGLKAISKQMKPLSQLAKQYQEAQATSIIAPEVTFPWFKQLLEIETTRVHWFTPTAIR